MTAEQMHAKTAEMRTRAIPTLGVNFDPEYAQILVEAKHPLLVGESTVVAVPIETYLLLSGQILVGGIVPMLTAQRRLAEATGQQPASDAPDGTERTGEDTP